MSDNTIDLAPDLRLCRLTLAHADALFAAIDSDRARLGRWLPFVETTRGVDDTSAYIRSVSLPPGSEQCLVFAIECEGAFAGLIGLNATDWDNAKTELGYWLVGRFEKRGIVTRAATCLIDRAFHRLGLNRVTLRCAVDNASSRAVALRLGFTLEGMERDAERFNDGRFVDAHVFSLLAREWKGPSAISNQRL